MDQFILPAPKLVGAPDTLKIEYVNGNILKAPYFDYASALVLLRLDEGISNYEVVPYTGE